MKTARITLLTLTALLTTAASALAGAVPFEQGGPVDSPSSPASQAIEADVDGDGDVDLFVQGTFPTLTWRENDGLDPELWPEYPIIAGFDPAFVLAAAVDLDGDGDVDLLAQRFSDLLWLDSDGGSPPTFTERAISSGDSFSDRSVGDLDGDGNLDVLGADSTNGLIWLQNDGASPPSWTRRVIDGASDWGLIDVADVNGDGKLDVIGGSRFGILTTYINWFENDGAAVPGWTSRQVATRPGTGAGISTARGADLDGDGDTDIVSAYGAGLFWFENDGGDPPIWSAREILDGLGPRKPTPVDLDLDGDLDLVSQELIGENVIYWENRLDEAFPAWGRTTLETYSGNPSILRVTDLDTDGDPDLLLAGAGARLAFFENRTIHRSAIFPTRSVIADSADRAIGLFAADIDGDGDTDALSASIDDATVAWYENDGSPAPSWTRRVISDTVIGAYAVHAADLDRDGDLDVLSSGLDDDTVSWHENTVGSIVLNDNTEFETVYKAGSTSITAPGIPTFKFAQGTSPLGMVANYTATFSDGSTGNLFDLPSWSWSTTVGITQVDPLISGDRDNVLLINGFSFAGGSAGALVTQLLSDTLEQDELYTLTADFGWRTDNSAPTLPTVLELYAGGTLLTPIASSSPALIQGQWVTHSRSYRVSNPGISGALEIEVGLGPNTDGQQLNIDRVVLRKQDSSAPPSWVKRVISNTALGSRNVVAADIDGDGDLDALGASEDDDTIAWYENDGASPPGWTERIVTTTADGAIGVFAADVDGDGDIDALSASQIDDTIAWYENDGASPPGWTRRVISDSVDNAFSVHAADVDGDGDLDALSASQNQDLIAWYENDGASPPNWTQRTITDSADLAISVVAADMDADGDLDAVAAANSGTIAWYENDGASPPRWTARTITDSAPLARTVFVADVDGDGALDVLSASDGDDTVAWYENLGGQFTNSSALCFSGALGEGQESALTATTVELNARRGDSPGRITTLTVDLGLEPADLATVISDLRVYRDDGTGDFEAGGSDVLLDTIDVGSLPANGGIYSIAVPQDPSAIVAGPATYLLTAVVRQDATASAFVNLSVSYALGSSSLVDANASPTIALTEEANSGAICSELRPLEREIVIDDPTDADDAVPGDGLCASGGGACTLRAAISEANATPGPDRIRLPAGLFQLTLIGDDNTNAAGDLDINDDLTLVGAGADQTTIDAAGINRVLNANGAITVSIQGLTITGGDTNGPGGGLLAAGSNVELQDCVVEGNTARGNGGGIAGDATSFVQTVDTRVVGNQAEFSAGGGIHSNGTVNLVWSEISGNLADVGGGGLYTDSVLQVLSSTISGNGAVGSFGGGILAEGTAFVALDNSTVAGNDAAGAGGGIQISGSANVNVNSTIIADNVPADCTGTILSSGYTILKNTSGCSVTNFGAPDQLGVDPLLTPLGDFGGATLSHRPQVGSPAIDAGSCGGAASERDQNGQTRPVDDPFTPNADDGCDVGAVETNLGESLPIIEVPIRWCGVDGAPSIDDPSLVGQATANDVMRRRHEIASDELYEPLAGIVFRSGGNFIIEDYPILADLDTSVGMPGDVVLDLEDGDFGEFQDLMNGCRAAWEALDKDIQGLTAVQINRFIDPAGNPIEVLGAGGRAQFGDAAGQATAGQLMLIDSFYRLSTNPEDSNERLFGHEAGHALSLLHGNGLDDDADTLLDNDDDQAAGLPRFDGPNLLQYRNGEELTLAQAQQMRAHILLTIPDGELQPFSDTIADVAEIDQEIKSILQFGYEELTELELKSLLQWELKSLLQFELKSLLQWELKSFLEWELKSLLQFELKSMLQWEQASVVQYGMDYSGTTATDTSTFNISLGSLPWFAPVRPDTRHYLYLDLDNDDSTGGYPVDFANPTDPGFNFPGQNNLDGEPLVGEERGVDLIVQVTMEVECPNQECDTFTMSEVFAFNDALQAYELVFTENEPDNVANATSLYVENGGVPLDYDDVPLGYSFRPQVPNQILFDAGWGFAAGPNGAVPNPIGVEVFTEIDCQGPLFNDDPTAPAADCQCLDCADCPDFPGCATEGTPKQLSGTRIVADRDRGLLTFEPPILPFATVAPLLAAEGQTVTVYVFDLPTDVVGDVEVTLDGIQLGTVPTSAIDASGEVSLTVPLPFGKLGDQRLSTGIVGRAPRASTEITITRDLAAPDNDGDGIPDATDPDDDNDGVDDVDENANLTDPFNGFECGDADLDSCDDCTFGSFNPADDGRDFDLDGLCDAGDPDDDNDGVDDTIDGEPRNPNACGDTDADLCDDCAVISNVPSPNNDGADFDGDGICDLSDSNAQPIALCTDVQVAANGSCQAAASIDAGSNDPEGLVQSLVESPAGPYGLGDTTVTLTITDTSGEFAECSGTVTVLDQTDPTIDACPEARTLVGSELDGTVALDDLTLEVGASDACGILEVTQTPPAGTALSAGTHTITLSATDVGGNSVDCETEVVVLDRLLSSSERVRVRFGKHQDGSECDEDGDEDDDEGDDEDGDDDDDDGPPVLDVPHCFTRLQLRGDVELRNAATLPIDVRQVGSTSVAANLVVSLSGQVISDEMLTLDVRDTNKEIWRYRRAGGAPQLGVKRLRLDWLESAAYDSHDGTGLGNDVPRIKTRFIGFDETDMKLRFKHVPRPFSVTFDDPVGGSYTIEVTNAHGHATVSPAGDYDLKSKRNWLTLTLPFRLTPDTAITFSPDCGTTFESIPVDTEFNYQPAGAKYSVVVDETAVSAALCDDPTTPVNSLSSPELDVQLVIGATGEEVVGTVDVDPDDWRRIDQFKWKLFPW